MQLDLIMSCIGVNSFIWQFVLWIPIFYFVLTGKRESNIKTISPNSHVKTRKS